MTSLSEESTLFRLDLTAAYPEPRDAVVPILSLWRDRRSAYRVRLTGPRFDGGTGFRPMDISGGGVGFLAPRHRAPNLAEALVLVHLEESAALRAVVQRVDLGLSSEAWVRVGARFIDVDAVARAALCAFVSP